MPDEEKVWSNEKIVNCDVICGLTKKRCSVPSLPRYTWGKKGDVQIICTVYTGSVHHAHYTPCCTNIKILWDIINHQQNSDVQYKCIIITQWATKTVNCTKTGGFFTVFCNNFFLESLSIIKSGSSVSFWNIYRFLHFSAKLFQNWHSRKKSKNQNSVERSFLSLLTRKHCDFSWIFNLKMKKATWVHMFWTGNGTY